MFHTYVRASSGRKIDIDRARRLMNDAIYDDAWHAARAHFAPKQFDDMDTASEFTRRTGRPCKAIAGSYTVPAQYVWDMYCRRHLDHYGAAFVPDVSTTWDE